MSSHRYPESHVFYRKLTRDFPLMVRGDGCWLEDEHGRRYLDASGGAFVANLGHGVSEIADAMAAQARRVAYVTGAWCTNEAVEAFARALAARLPGDLEYVYPLSSGSEAIEAALKLARQYWVESGRPGKHKVLALAPGYHGNTLLALSASARGSYRTLYADWLVAVPNVPAPYPYRCACHGEAPLCPACSGDALEATIIAEGPESVSAFVAEPVGGSSTGASVPAPGYFGRVREICDRYGVLFIADEVLSGAGRTGRFAAVEHQGVVPDIMTVGKGITGGYAPLSAVVAPRRIVDVIATGSGALNHAQTFSHHAVACAAGVAALEYLSAHHLVERCATVAPRFHAALATLRGQPHVGDVRGIGLLAGIELVRDVETGEPFPRAMKFAERFTEHAQRGGLIVWPNGGQAKGDDGDVIMLAPPFIITDAEIRELVARFAHALDLTIAEAQRT
jgi:hypothetical protein